MVGINRLKGVFDGNSQVKAQNKLPHKYIGLQESSSTLN